MPRSSVYSRAMKHARCISVSIYCSDPCELLSDKVKNLSNTVLLLLMLMAVYSHYMVNDKFERIAPALVSRNVGYCWEISFDKWKINWNGCAQVFFFMLTGRLVIDWQLRREDTQSVTANGVDDKTKKQDWAELWLENAYLFPCYLILIVSFLQYDRCRTIWANHSFRKYHTLFAFVISELELLPRNIKIIQFFLS